MRTLFPKLAYRRQWRPVPTTTDYFRLSFPREGGTGRSILGLVDIEHGDTLTLSFSLYFATVKVRLQVAPSGVRVVDSPDDPSFGDVSSFLDTFVDWFADPDRRMSLLQFIARQHSPERANAQHLDMLKAHGAGPGAQYGRIFLLANIAAGAVPADQAPLALAMVESGYDGTLEDLLTVTATSRAER